MIGIRSHFAAGSGAIAIETREETRLLRDILSELPPTATVATIAAPGGPLKDAKTGRPIDALTGLPAAYQWAQNAPARAVVCYDWHTLCNNAGQWRALIEALPALRSPRGAKPTDPASLIIFVGPAFDLTTANPLRGALPILPYAPPDRESIAKTAEALAPIPPEVRESVIDALCGLSADSAEQAAAEVLARGQGWNVPALQLTKTRELKTAGLEIWEPEPELGGLSGLRQYCETRIFPFRQDRQLSVRRILCAGLPGTGKSYSARWIAHRLQTKAARLSIPALKAGIVGASEGNLRRALRVIDSMSQDAPLVVVLDEIDTIARDGLDGGTSSGMFAELLTWLQESTSQAIVLATLNRLDKLDAALESRFQARFFMDLPTHSERAAVSAIHLRRLNCANPEASARTIADYTEGFSSREIAESLIPDLAALTNRTPNAQMTAQLAAGITPASKSQGEQLQRMRSAAQTLRRANDPDDGPAMPNRRQVTSN